MATQAASLPRSSSTRAAAPITLVLGGARSGKSRYAEGVVADLRAPQAVYIATAEAGDAEMRARIAEHRARRGAGWITIEAPLDLAGALDEAGGRPALIDCLTLWVSNLMQGSRDVGAEGERLTGALAQARAPVVLVSNEVGLGIVPENALARAFRDHAGRLNQRIAQAADRVVFIAAGLPLILKETR
jgi:adenosyl cobinamide kinase/adenosyl cobinamide phosphate guanylyltransferase